MAEPIDYLALYSSNCKQCGYLDEQEPVKHERCHFTKGNKDCPASEVRLVVIGKATRMAKRLVLARKNRDVDAEAKILAAVSKESAAFKTRFYDDLESLCTPKEKSLRS